MSFRKHLSQPWFNLVKNGKKTIEGRLKKNDWVELKVGDIIIFWNDDSDPDSEVEVKVISVTSYQSFMEMLEAEGVEKVLPEVSLEESKQIYSRIYSAEMEKQYGVIAIKLELK